MKPETQRRLTACFLITAGLVALGVGSVPLLIGGSIALGLGVFTVLVTT